MTPSPISWLPGIRAALNRQIKRTKPDMVVASDAVAGIVSLRSGATGDAASAEWTDGVVRALQQVKRPGTRVVVLAPNPTGRSVSECATRFAGPEDCVSPISAAWTAKRSADEAAAKKAGVRYVDTRAWFCSGGGRCPIFSAGTPIRWDGMHLTAAYARRLGPQLAAELIAD